MSEKLYEALEVCLQALETGADSESALNLFPELQEELSPLLDASRQARLLAVPQVPEAAQRRGKARVLAHAAALHASAAASQRKQRAIFTFQRLAISLGVSLLFLFSSTGLVRVSAGALPGEYLYPVKRTWEDVRLLFVFDPQSREEMEVEFERERLHEVDELLAEGRHEPISFRGVVTKQTDSLWVVSGVDVHITPQSHLPARPVTPGTAVYLQGRTDAQGFVEADFIEVVEPGHILPTREPAEAEPQEDNSNEDRSGPDENTNENNNEGEPESPSNENQNDNENENGNENGNENSNDHGDDGGNDNSGDNGNGNDEDHNENGGKGENENEKDKGDNSGPGDGEGEDNE
jgi:hypothetical protein